MVNLAATLIVIVLGVKLFMALIGHPIIDWLDARTSRITMTEARRRAYLTARHQWPQRLTSWTRADVIALVIALSLIGLVRWSLR